MRSIGRRAGRRHSNSCLMMILIHDTVALSGLRETDWEIRDTVALSGLRETDWERWHGE